MDSFASLLLAPKSDKTQLLVRLLFVFFAIYLYILTNSSNEKLLDNQWAVRTSLSTDSMYVSLLSVLEATILIIFTMYLILRIRYSWIYTGLIIGACVIDSLFHSVYTWGDLAGIFDQSFLTGFKEFFIGYNSTLRPALIVGVGLVVLIVDSFSDNKCVTITST